MGLSADVTGVRDFAKASFLFHCRAIHQGLSVAQKSGEFNCLLVLSKWITGTSPVMTTVEDGRAEKSSERWPEHNN